MPNEREGYETQYSDGRFVDFVDEHTNPVSEVGTPSLMSGGYYDLDAPYQILPFDRVEFAQYRGMDEGDDPAIAERSEITLFIGELEIIAVTFNLLTDQYTMDLNGTGDTDLSTTYRYFPASLVKILKKLEDEGRLVEVVEDGEGDL